MMPIVFWASLAPCPRLNAAADTSWPRRKPSVEAVDPFGTRWTRPRDDDHEDERRAARPMSGDEHDEHADLAEPFADEHVEPGLGHRGAGHAADQRVRRATWAARGRR